MSLPNRQSTQKHKARGMHVSSLSIKVVLLMGAVILAACVIVIVMTYRSEQRRQMESLSANGSAQLRAITRQAEIRMNRVEAAATTIAYDDAVHDLLVTESVGDYIARLKYDVLNRMKTSEALLSDLSADLTLLISNTNMPEAYETAVHMDRLSENHAFQEWMNASNLSCWTVLQQTANWQSISGSTLNCFVRVQSGLNHLIGAVQCAVPLDKIFTDEGTLEKENALTVYFHDDIIWQTGNMDETVSREYITLSDTFSNIDLTFTLLVDATQARNQAMQNALSSVLMVACIGAGLMMVTATIIQLMMRRLTLITRAVEDIPASGQLTAPLPAPGSDEAGKLSIAFTELMQRRDAYYHDLLQSEKAKRYAQQEALQFQMNPHFLFNSLYWLQLQLEEQGVTPVLSEAVAQMGIVLHYNLEGSSITSIAEEKRHVIAYVSLMEAMTNSTISLSLEAAPELDQLQVLRFILQPLLENAIRHGRIEGQTLNIHIQIYTCEEKNHLILQVENDGKAIEQSELAKLKALLCEESVTTVTDHHGIGLSNLHKRLMLMYSGAARMEIDAQSSGTQLRIILPLDQCAQRS